MRNIGIRNAPCWEPNVLNASCTNCYCECVSASSAKLQLRSARARWSSGECVALNIHFPVSNIFVQARNKKCLQQVWLCHWRLVSSMSIASHLYSLASFRHSLSVSGKWNSLFHYWTNNFIYRYMPWSTFKSVTPLMEQLVILLQVFVCPLYLLESVIGFDDGFGNQSDWMFPLLTLATY